jgi:hypothetical protein
MSPLVKLTFLCEAVVVVFIVIIFQPVFCLTGFGPVNSKVLVWLLTSRVARIGRVVGMPRTCGALVSGPHKRTMSITGFGKHVRVAHNLVDLDEFWRNQTWRKA